MLNSTKQDLVKAMIVVKKTEQYELIKLQRQQLMTYRLSIKVKEIVSTMKVI